MKLIDNIYKTKNLSDYGIFILIALVVIVILGNLLIPTYSIQNIDRQVLNLKGKYLKYDDAPHVEEFILSVKNSKGYICMGTSESTPLRDGNYYEFLDQDTTYNTRFSILGGAGRTCGIHMAMLLNHKDIIDSLQIIYFINPVYWRSELNGFDKGYWMRYLNYYTYQNTLSADKDALFAGISQKYAKELNFGEKFLHYATAWLRKIRKPFFQDMRYLLNEEKYLDDLAFIAHKKEGFGQFDHFGKIDTSYLDTSWNITHEFRERTWLNPMVDKDYRTRELKHFIHLCNKLNVKATYILGPVNEIYISNYHPPYLQDYLKKVDEIRLLLEEENVDYVDMTWLGSVPGSFIDNQHHSSYGAYLIYREIKQHLHEKEDH
ncbi:MAG: D-alanyl-lipoteichoic acid biosynthesis protein DltD [Bacteroidales bacterium]|nr:D-alanyl-lipoteichoic acid biosynthesis protein DltD [Bacteroidales bacterium]